jgi:hypothetical protein
MCVTVLPGSSTVVTWKCGSGTGSQQWTGYPDGTLRSDGKCLEPTGPQAGAPVRVQILRKNPGCPLWERADRGKEVTG